MNILNSQLFYSESIQEGSLILQEQEAVHCSLVLRKQVGDIIHVLDGKGNLYKCGIDSMSKRQVDCSIISKEFKEQTESLSLAVAPTKNRDRLEWLVEKVVELGARKVYFLHTQRTERNRINFDRIAKKAIGAMKQSQRFYLPVFEEIDYKEIIGRSYPKKYIAHCAIDDKKKSALNVSEKIETLVLIGPEGDFTVEEVEEAKSEGFESLDLGDFRLRTETAAIAVAVLANA